MHLSPLTERPERPRLRTGLVLALSLALCELASAAPLSRDTGDYFALSFRRMRLKDFYIEAPGCNLGVNCQETGRNCGQLNSTGAVVTEPGQIVSANLCGPGSFYEVFRNNTSARCAPDCGMITEDGPGPSCENTFTAPILGDLDNDGNPSCSEDCDVDIGDVAAACEVRYPFPPCDLSREVRAFARSDCSPLEFDLVPGNRQCDLAAGTYGYIRVRNRGRISFGAGTTVACMLAVGKATRVTSTGPAVVLVPGYGRASFNNMSDVGGDCRSFKVATEYGPVRFAKHGEFHLDACTLAGTMKLGHDNNLRGRFISGEFLVSNFNSTGACCEPTTTSTSTSTTTTSSTTTTTSTPSTTNPSVTTTTSTTSTTNPQQPGICCEDLSEEPSICISAQTELDCREAGGTPGPAGSICQGTPDGGGRCAETPNTPGGCCQFTGSCAIGGALDEARCTSLGGAFVSDALCTPDGNCIPVTTTSTIATSTTVTTATSTTTFTTVTTTSTTTTTNPQQPGICCEDANEEPSICISAQNEVDCRETGGTPGPAGSTCQAASDGGGRCKDTPGTPGGCCQFVGLCAIGGGLDEVTCTSLGGAFIADAECDPDGGCVPVTTTSTIVSSSTTTTLTSSTVTTTITTSTTSTTVQGVCCEDKDQLPWTCSSAPTAEACQESGGTPGLPGEICRVAPLGAVCDSGPPPPGGCCEKPDQCTVGGTLEKCLDFGGKFVPNGACLGNGKCVTVTTTTSPKPTTTSTTLPGKGFTRTLGFYKTHPGVTEWILDQVGGLTVCGITITNVDIDDAHSALEALCISPKGDQRLQLVRQLTAAGLTMAAGGATFHAFDACNELCASGGGSIYDGGDCINSADAFNNSGDNLPAPFDGFESGHPEFCQIAHNTACNVLTPSSCLE